MSFYRTIYFSGLQVIQIISTFEGTILKNILKCFIMRYLWLYISKLLWPFITILIDVLLPLQLTFYVFCDFSQCLWNFSVSHNRNCMHPILFSYYLSLFKHKKRWIMLLFIMALLKCFFYLSIYWILVAINCLIRRNISIIKIFIIVFLTIYYLTFHFSKCKQLRKA